MAIAIRDVREQELDSVLALNNAASPSILPLDAARMRWFFDYADYFRVAQCDGHLAGFLIALREQAAYDSPNFLWFRDHYPEFVYIDRIVLAKPYRGLGLGRLFYCDVQSYSEIRVPLLTCEVFLEPRDDASVLFHGTFGFNEVGQQSMRNAGKRVSLLVKELPSYAYVRDTYLHNGQLPKLPWLMERADRVAPNKARAAGEN